MNERGPSLEPWGILPQSVFQEETRLPTLTRWHRWRRYDANHLSRQWLVLKFLSLVNRMLWLTMLKAFLKSTNKARTEPLLSRVCSHLCWIAISACVVDLPGRQPNWFSSRDGSNDGISQSLTMPSRTLATVGRREIGRRSFWMEGGGWILGTGTTSAEFQIGGTNPSLIDELKMAAS